MKRERREFVEKVAQMLIATLRRADVSYISLEELGEIWEEALAETVRFVDDEDGTVLVECLRLLRKNGEIAMENITGLEILLHLKKGLRSNSRVIIHVVPRSGPKPGQRSGPPLILKPPPRRPERQVRPTPPPPTKPTINISEAPAEYLTQALAALRKRARPCGDWYTLGDSPEEVVLGGIVHASRHQAEKLTAKLQLLGLLLVCPTGCCHVKAQPERIDSSLIGTWL